MITDNDILNHFFYKYKNKLRLKTKLLNNIPKDLVYYLSNRFDDSESIKESIIRIYHKIEKRPTCKICNKKLNFTGLTNIPFRQTCSKECNYKLISNSYKNTCLSKYGVKNVSSIEYIKEKKKQTYIKHFNADNPLKNELIKNKVKNKLLSKQKEIHEKIKNTCIKKYGVNNTSQLPEIKNKIKNTFIQKYGVSNAMQIQSVKNKFDWDKIINKQIETKKKNNSFHISKSEEVTYQLLKEKYKDVERQYKSDVYPFACDFFIPSLDLYIECNYHWTHGGHPYDKNNKEDQLILEQWKKKNTKFYNNAINTWTIRDVKKRTVAKENNLNYIEFFSILDFEKFFKKI